MAKTETLITRKLKMRLYTRANLWQGFVPYFEFTGAQDGTISQQTGSRGRERRAHQVVEFRNFVCAHVNRRDPRSRRFLQYLSMESARSMLLVRDAKTGKVLVQPPDKADVGRWLVRRKVGFGRASKNESEIVKEVGTDFFDEIDKYRNWSFSFSDYYDVIVWDLEPGLPFESLYNAIHDVSCLRFSLSLVVYANL